MKTLKSLLLALSILGATGVMASAQVIIQLKPQAQPSAGSLNGEQDDDSLVHEIFAPISARLNLTTAQRFRIAAIARATMLKADALFTQLDQLDDQLDEASFTASLDEVRLLELADKQGAILSQIISMKARAKAQFYQLLTAEQRAIVAEQFRARAAEEAALDAISNW